MTADKSAQLLVPGELKRERAAKRRIAPGAPVVGADGQFSSPPGIAIQGWKRPTTARMARILRAIGLTPSQHGVWVGWPAKKGLAMNPTWTEKQWYFCVLENYEMIKNPPEMEAK